MITSIKFVLIKGLCLHENYYSSFIAVLKIPFNNLIAFLLCVDFGLSYTLVE